MQSLKAVVGRALATTRKVVPAGSIVLGLGFTIAWISLLGYGVFALVLRLAI